MPPQPVQRHEVNGSTAAFAMWRCNHKWRRLHAGLRLQAVARRRAKGSKQIAFIAPKRYTLLCCPAGRLLCLGEPLEHEDLARSLDFEAIRQPPRLALYKAQGQRAGKLL